MKGLNDSVKTSEAYEFEENMQNDFSNVYSNFFNSSIRSLDHLKSILKHMRVTFEERRVEHCNYEIFVRGNLVFQCSKEFKLTAWLFFNNSAEFTTKAESWLEGEDVTVGHVVTFCEEYHRRNLFKKMCSQRVFLGISSCEEEKERIH